VVFCKSLSIPEKLLQSEVENPSRAARKELFLSMMMVVHLLKIGRSFGFHLRWLVRLLCTAQQ
jgi:hypothetical protein